MLTDWHDNMSAVSLKTCRRGNFGSLHYIDPSVNARKVYIILKEEKSECLLEFLLISLYNPRQVSKQSSAPCRIIFMAAFTSLIFISSLFLLHFSPASGSHRNNHGNGSVIGALIDRSSREGKEAAVAMEIAMADINTQYGYTSQGLVLHVKNTRSSPLQAALQGNNICIIAFCCVVYVSYVLY